MSAHIASGAKQSYPFQMRWGAAGTSGPGLTDSSYPESKSVIPEWKFRSKSIIFPTRL